MKEVLNKQLKMSYHSDVDKLKKQLHQPKDANKLPNLQMSFKNQAETGVIQSWKLCTIFDQLHNLILLFSRELNT